MLSDLYSTLLDELGRALKMKEPLQPNKSNSCVLKMPSGLRIQVEMDPYENNTLIGALLGEVPSGSYRDNIFREALKTNGAPHPRYGSLAFIPQSAQLILCASFPVKNLQGATIATFLEPFSAKAMIWKEALARGEVPIYTPPLSSARGGGGMMFGMRP